MSTKEKLKEENALLKAEVGLLKHKLGRLLGAEQEWVLIEPEEYARLKAEVERLRKVTDVMSDAIDIYRGWVRLPGDGPFREHLNMIIELMQAKDEWNAAQIAAKEGKPSETKSPSFIEDLGNGVEKHDLLFRYPAKEGKPSV